MVGELAPSCWRHCPGAAGTASTHPALIQRGAGTPRARHEARRVGGIGLLLHHELGVAPSCVKARKYSGQGKGLVLLGSALLLPSSASPRFVRL